MATNQITVPKPAQLEDALLLPLGSGMAEKLGVGRKARLLDQAVINRLPVPPGYILLDRMWVLAVAEGHIKVEGERVVCEDATALYAALGLPSFPPKAEVVVRSAFSIEDTPRRQSAEHFAAVAGVDPTKPKAFIDALCEVWSSSLEYDNIRRDVLVMQQVAAKHAGVALTQPGYEDDRVRFTDGPADALLSGEADGDTLELPRLRAYEKGPREEGTPRAAADWRDRLQVLLRRVRAQVGDRAWDVEWADDGQTAYLLQVRAVTAAPHRKESFTRGHYREALPDLPSTYMTHLIESAGEELYAWYRQFDNDLPSGRPLITVFKGRPYINLSLMTETMRSLGLPTSFVTDDIGGENINAAGFKPGRALAKLPSLAGLGASQLRAVASAGKTGTALVRQAESPGSTFNEVNNTFREMYVAFNHEMFNLSLALSLPLAQLRRGDKLTEMAAATRTITTQMYDDLVPLRRYVANNNTLIPALARGEQPDDAEFRRLFGLYLARYGHRGIYEGDIARPRYSEDPSPLLAALTHDSQIPAPPAPKDDSLGPIASRAQKLIVAREALRHDALRAFMKIRSRLLELGTAAVEAGQIPQASTVFDLTPTEAALLDVGWQPGAALFETRTAERADQQQAHLPDVLHRADNPDDTTPDAPPDATTLTGIGLAGGQVSGQAWVLQTPETTLPDGFTPASTILVARSVDSGWIPTFTKVAGVVVEAGNDLSHGSVILRELRLPSVTHVKAATRALKTGDAITLDGSRGVVKRG